MTVRQLLTSLDAAELTEWQAFFKLEAEERRRADLDDKARAGLNARKAKRRGGP